jgi:hypothetical protein
MEDRRESRVGTVRNRKLGCDGLLMEDNNQEIGYFDRDGDAGEIRDHGGPRA